MANLEEQLIQDVKTGKHVSLERGLLIFSGLQTELEIKEYTQKLDQIYEGFIERLKTKSAVGLSTLRKYMLGSMAKSLFEYLWNTKPKRCDGNFLLTDVIDAQLSTDVDLRVGSCVGLTALYMVLGLRENLNLSILVSDSHILTRLRVDGTIYNIDNTDPLGFDCDLEDRYFAEYPAVNLLANVLNSRGIEKERAENLEKAKEDYDRAIQINPEYANAHNNRGNIKSRQNDYIGSMRDYNKAIELNPQFVEAYCNRGIAKENLADYNGAIRDFDRATELDPGYIDAFVRRGVLKQSSGDFAGAIKDFDRVIELDPQAVNKIRRLRELAEQLQKEMEA